jgi:hypothetical protein
MIAALMMLIYANFGGMAYIGDDQSFFHMTSFGNIGFPEAVVIREVLWMEGSANGKQQNAYYHWHC